MDTMNEVKVNHVDTAISALADKWEPIQQDDNKEPDTILICRIKDVNSGNLNINIKVLKYSVVESIFNRSNYPPHVYETLPKLLAHKRANPVDHYAMVLMVDDYLPYGVTGVYSKLCKYPKMSGLKSDTKGSIGMVRTTSDDLDYHTKAAMGALADNWERVQEEDIRKPDNMVLSTLKYVNERSTHINTSVIPYSDIERSLRMSGGYKDVRKQLPILLAHKRANRTNNYSMIIMVEGYLPDIFVDVICGSYSQLDKYRRTNPSRRI